MAQNITDVMGQIRGGFALAQAGKKLEEVVAAVRATREAGSVTLTITVKPDKSDERIISMKPKLTFKVPEKAFSEGIFFVGPDGKLTKDDPAQLDMYEERRQAGVATLAANESNLSKIGQG